ncbi:26S proteasome non-ATPase regulatory subunit 2 isoform X1 [Nematostella vectensis]|uniref:26S proteasome non-ATPase regulatory subunit 2 isoform X1 n=1 Tax=Nematostella vectensis TaxID=45351 RepID=UPI0020773B93|nr:26S proteasome non-ATPase regulatory subunit 2 isoform X1 [Nematostella vectensis]
MAPTAATEQKKTEKESKKDEAKAKDEPKREEEVELSEEDKLLQEELTMLVERLKERNVSLHKPALEALRSQIRASTSSMTSVPKPLKFLRPHYASMKEVYQGWPDGENKRFLADIISVLAMVSEGRECLQFRMLGSKESLESWGHEYVRHLSEEIRAEYGERLCKEITIEQLVGLAQEIIPYNMQHNAETDACDLLMEIERLDLLEGYTDKNNFQRVCLYLTSCVNYVPEPEDSTLLRTALSIFRKFDRQPEALQLAIQLNDIELVKEIFLSCTGSEEKKLIQRQMAFMLARQQIFLELDEDMDDYEDLMLIMSNSLLNNNFLSLARELDIMEPKVPEDIYKTHLENKGISSGVSLDSARQNLASSFVNAFVNAAFGVDKLLTEDGNKWIYKNKEHGMMSTTASLGLILLWDVDGGLTQIDKYLYSSDDYIKAGALLACGIVNSGVRNECDPARALLSDYVLHSSNIMRLGSVVGLGLAYAGSNSEDILSLLLPVLTDSRSNVEVTGMASVASGMVAIGTCNGEVTSTILQAMMEQTEVQVKDSYSRYLALGLGLTFLGKQEAAEATLEALKVVPQPLGRWASILVEICAYAGTGNVLKVQNLLHLCSEHFDQKEGEEKEKSKESKEKKEEEKEEDGSHQGIAVLGIALIAMGEEIGAQMGLRAFNHLLQYGEPVIRRAVPLALALLSASNPQLPIIDTLSKLSHDSDAEVAHNAIFAMGIVGAGTNNARLAGMLRQLAMYYHKDANNLFMVRLAQGLVHMGKGTLTVGPYHSDRSLLMPVAVGGLLTVLVSFLDVKNIILGKSHYVLFHLVSAMQPRMLVTFDTELRPKPVTVRVGQAVDVVGQAGKPKTITGFQTHTTPVLLAHGERAELATEEFISLASIMEGFVILKKNPDYEKDAV